MSKLNLKLTLILSGLLFVIPILGIATSTDNKILSQENRTIAKFPEFNNKFLSNFSAYLNDRMLLRDVITDKFYGLWAQFFAQDISHTSFVTGKNDFLFLGNSYDSSVKKHTGLFEIDKATLKNYLEKINNLKTFFAPIPFFFMIAPDKESIYGEYYPLLLSNDTNFLNKLLPFLHADFNVVDPVKTLLEAKSEGDLLYFLDDSHWNNKGAFIAFNYLLTQMGLATFNLDFLPSKHNPGDLTRIAGIKGDQYTDKQDTFLPKIDYQVKVRFSENPAEIIELTSPHFPSQNDIIKRKGALIVHENARYDKTLLLISDSFGIAVAPFASYLFKKVIWFSRYTSNEEIFESFKQFDPLQPDFVVYLNVERRIGES